MGAETDILKEELKTAYFVCDDLMVVKKVTGGIVLVIGKKPPFNTFSLKADQTERFFKWIDREFSRDK